MEFSKIESTSSNKQNIYLQRQSKLETLITNNNLGGLLLNPGPTLEYFTGLHFHLSERPIIVFIIPNYPLLAILPEFESIQLDALPFNVKAFTYDENPDTWIVAFKKAFSNIEIFNNHLCIESNQLRFLEINYIQQAAPDIQLMSGDDLIASLRIIKDPDEIAAMRKASDIAQIAFLKTLTNIKEGMSEKDIASELSYQLLKAGSEPDFPFLPIIASGSNSANPHASPGNRQIMNGDVIIIDWGASNNGYFSDITRTLSLGKPNQTISNIAKLVQKANKTGRELVKPGKTAGEIDHAVRSVIETHGYGEYFTHRTGHGLGLNAHEPPFIRSGNQRKLQQGMVFTIEPGIYIPQKGGVRIEDDILVTDNGCESLTDLSRNLWIIGN